MFPVHFNQLGVLFNLKNSYKSPPPRCSQINPEDFNEAFCKRLTHFRKTFPRTTETFICASCEIEGLGKFLRLQGSHKNSLSS